MLKEVSVSKEYIDTVCDWLESWAKKDSSWAIPQFLKKHGIGWPYLRSMMDISPLLHNVFEVTVSGLCEKWMLYGMNTDYVPKHMVKIMTKYLNVYDSHAYFVDQEAKKDVAQNTRFSVNNYDIEDYSAEQLKGLYRKLYDTNDKKKVRKKPAK